MNQQEFYSLPEVQEQLEIQKRNPWNSEKHRAAFFEVAEIAKKYGVYDQYVATGGLIYD